MFCVKLNFNINDIKRNNKFFNLINNFQIHFLFIIFKINILELTLLTLDYLIIVKLPKKNLLYLQNYKYFDELFFNLINLYLKKQLCITKHRRQFFY